MRIFEHVLTGAAICLAATLSTARAAEEGIGKSDQVLVPSETRIVLHLDGVVANGEARVTLRDGGVATLFDDAGKGVQLTARQVGPATVVVDATEIQGKGLAKNGDVASVVSYGKVYAPITLGTGEAKAVRDLGLTISASLETVAVSAKSPPICPDGKVAAATQAKFGDPDQCCVRCYGESICAYCVQLPCGWCCAQ